MIGRRRTTPPPACGLNDRDVQAFEEAHGATMTDLVGRHLLRRSVARVAARKRWTLRNCAAALRSTTASLRAGSLHRSPASDGDQVTAAGTMPASSATSSECVVELRRGGRFIGEMRVTGSADAPRVDFQIDSPGISQGPMRRLLNLASKRPGLHRAEMTSHGILRTTEAADPPCAPTLADLDRWADELESIAALVEDPAAAALHAEIVASHRKGSELARVEAGAIGAAHVRIIAASPGGEPPRIVIPGYAMETQLVTRLEIAERRPCVVIATLAQTVTVVSLQHTTMDAITDPVEIMRAYGRIDGLAS
jgi:hypothetical protein